jgi:hypothetical protein
MPIEMDATTRWETEAMRASGSQRSNPPRPSAKRQSQGGSTPSDIGTDRRWVTLKEAEAATQIPANTIRKWIRKDTVASYLESDGHMALRMVDLDSLLARAKALGRAVVEVAPPDDEPAPVPLSRGTEEERSDDSGGSRERSDRRGTGEPASQGDEESADDRSATEEEPSDESEELAVPKTSSSQPDGTMLVPIDAWNKMLNQLGNLHEAGQQLAEARERAAKAETESTFLRERLSEMRQASVPLSQTSVPLSRGTGESASQGDQDRDASVPPSTGTGESASQGDEEGDASVPLSRGTGESASQGDQESDASVPLSRGTGESASQGDKEGASSDPHRSVDTTTYWRYLTTGWRDRKRRSRR